MVNIIKPTNAVSANTTINGLFNQSCSWPKSNISCKAPIHSTNNNKPPISIFNLAVAVSAGFNKRIAAIAQPIPTGILIKKIQCQDKLSLIAPPKIGPKMGPTTVVMAHMPMA